VKKAVSKTATCGIEGNSSRAASMPSTAAGLCSGASAPRSAIWSRTQESMSFGAEKRAPPCTTRWPTATTFASSRESPAASNSSITTRMATTWSGTSPVYGWVIEPVSSRASPPSSPIRSTMPEANTSSATGSSSWNFSDEEPEFSTSTVAASGTPGARSAPSEEGPAGEGAVMRSPSSGRPRRPPPGPGWR
jgi:hypothetical protein